MNMTMLRFKVGERSTLQGERKELGEVNVAIDNIAFTEKITVTGNMTEDQASGVKARVKRILRAYEAYLWSYWWDVDTGIELERVS